MQLCAHLHAYVQLCVWEQKQERAYVLTYLHITFSLMLLLLLVQVEASSERRRRKKRWESLRCWLYCVMCDDSQEWFVMTTMGNVWWQLWVIVVYVIIAKNDLWWQSYRLECCARWKRAEEERKKEVWRGNHEYCVVTGMSSGTGRDGCTGGPDDSQWCRCYD